MAGPGKIENLTPFQKGNEIGKLGGRPKGVSLTTLLQRAIDAPLEMKNKQTGEVEKKPTSEWLMAVMVREALKGDRSLIKEVWDRLEGKPLQKIETESKVAMDFSTMTDEQLKTAIEAMKNNE